MTDDQKKETYPVIPEKHWWTLRKRFQQSIPSNVTPGFLATTLNMQEKSAKSNIIPSLVMMGIIDQDGKPTNRATRWRDDQKYPEVCHEIRTEIYPQELLEAAPGPSIDRGAVERWFASKTGAGKVAVQRFAKVYEFLASAELPKPKGRARRKASERISPIPTADEGPPVLSDFVPSIHIDIQIHISPEAKPDQIDQIFASMAKYLRK
jgi:hypothetical protein